MTAGRQKHIMMGLQGADREFRIISNEQTRLLTGDKIFIGRYSDCISTGFSRAALLMPSEPTDSPTADFEACVCLFTTSSSSLRRGHKHSRVVPGLLDRLNNQCIVLKDVHGALSLRIVLQSCRLILVRALIQHVFRDCLTRG